MARTQKEIPERSFKRLAFWSTVLGLALMAAGLKQLIVDKRFLVFLALFAGGGALASAVPYFYRPRAEPGWTVELFTREGCSLCEEPAAWLAAKSKEYDFAVWETNVDSDPALAGKYGDFVPVAVLDGKEELFRLQADYRAIEKRFRALADARVRRVRG